MADAAHSVTATFMMRAHTMFSIMSILRFVVEHRALHRRGHGSAGLGAAALARAWPRAAAYHIPARALRAAVVNIVLLEKKHNCHLSCQVCVHGARAARWARAPERARAACAYWPRPRAYLRQRRHHQRAVGHVRASGALIDN